MFMSYYFLYFSVLHLEMSSGGKVIGVTFVIVIVLLSQDFIQVHSAGATIIGSREGWVITEHSNITLDCRVLISGGASPYYSCAVISFTKNETIINEDLKHVRSGPSFADNKVICTMTVLRVESEDSGLYGCCSTDKTTGLCYKHPTKELNVIPLSTIVQTTLETTTSIAVTSVATTTALNSPEDVTYNKVTGSSENNSSLSKSENSAQVQHTIHLIHKTIWPALLVTAIIIVVIVVLFETRCARKTSTDKAIPENVAGIAEYHSPDFDTEVENG